MKAVIDGVILEGTPEEIIEYVRLQQEVESTVKQQTSPSWIHPLYRLGGGTALFSPPKSDCIAWL